MSPPKRLTIPAQSNCSDSLKPNLRRIPCPILPSGNTVSRAPSNEDLGSIKSFALAEVADGAKSRVALRAANHLAASSLAWA